MHNGLEASRRQAHRARFVQEHYPEYISRLNRPESNVSHNRRLGLEIVKDLLPDVYDTVATVCGRLNVPLSAVRAFVHPGVDMQASCSAGNGKCIIQISSGLIESLEPGELAFVIGHELAHFLLDHHYIQGADTASIAARQLSRAREISADRLGLIACRDPDTAMRAIIKTFSGLSARHLRFDAVAFLGQSTGDGGRENWVSGVLDTHPTFAVRAKCLIHFSSILHHWGDASWDSHFAKSDKRTAKDFLKFGEAKAAQAITTLKTTAAQWVWLLACSADGQISSEHMAQISEKFGPRFTEKLRKNFHNVAKIDVLSFIKTNAHDAFQALNDQVPSQADNILNEILAECHQVLGLNIDIAKIRSQVMKRH